MIWALSKFVLLTCWGNTRAVDDAAAVGFDREGPDALLDLDILDEGEPLSNDLGLASSSRCRFWRPSGVLIKKVGYRA